MQFTIPQFIDIEDRIIGPVSTRQFVIFIVGIVFLFVAYKLLPFILFLPVGLFIGALIGTLGFLKVNGQPFHQFILNFLQTVFRPTLKVWKKDTSPEIIRIVKEEEPVQIPFQHKQLAPASRLSLLSLIVDTGGHYQEEDWEMNENDFLKEQQRER